jgi:hypothetical protein
VVASFLAGADVDKVLVAEHTVGDAAFWNADTRAFLDNRLVDRTTGEIILA